jgi:UDP-2,3-diacylglucosamine pyrophosphatase LpxH
LEQNERSILVVGDLHLHPGSDPSLVADFARLLDSRPAGKLVINGDAFDLDRVAGEHRAGEGGYRAACRLGNTLEKFPGFCEAISSWADRGGEIIWLPGNHDAELCLPVVRGVLMHGIGRAAGRVRFEPRCYKADGLYIEHGHQNDPDNSFFPDTAAAVAKQRLSALPLGCLTTRFLLCRIPAYDNQGDNHATPGRVLLRVIKNHGRATPRMVFLYILAAMRIAWQAILARRRRDAEARSSMASPWHVLERMYLDRLAMAGILSLIMMISLLGAAPPHTALVAGVPCAAFLLWPPSRRRLYRHRDRTGCRRAARSILQKSDGVVVMGHTHYAERLQWPHRVYLNPGAFFEKQKAGRPFVVIDGPTVKVDFLPRSQ